MKYPLDPNAELLIWGPAPMKSMLAYAASFKGLFIDFPKLFPGYNWPKALIMTHKDRLVWMHEALEIQRNGGRLFLDRMLPKDIRDDARSKWREACDELRAVEQEIMRATLSELSVDELLQLWMKFHLLVDAFWAHSSLPELSNYGSAEILQKEIGPYVPAAEIGALMEALTAPVGLSFYQEEEIDLAETNDITAHQRNYFWLKNSYTNVEVLPVEFFEKRKAELPLDTRVAVKDRLAATLSLKTAMQEKHSLSQRIMDIAEGIADGIVWQDARKKEIWIYLHYEDLMIQEMSRRTSVQKDRIKLLTSYEAADFLKGIISISDFDWRAEGAAFVFDDQGNSRIDSAEISEMYWKIYVQQNVDSETTEFKGVVASRGAGVVRGTVRIILDAHNAPDMEQGEILVTTMTTPEFVFLMKKAGAIVTDTGGLTSHAAIVSRELGVPCIVGTKVATSILKDGDMVEVDAQKGIVRKL